MELVINRHEVSIMKDEYILEIFVPTVNSATLYTSVVKTVDLMLSVLTIKFFF